MYTGVQTTIGKMTSDFEAALSKAPEGKLNLTEDMNKAKEELANSRIVFKGDFDRSAYSYEYKPWDISTINSEGEGVFQATAKHAAKMGVIEHYQGNKNKEKSFDEELFGRKFSNEYDRAWFFNDYDPIDYARKKYPIDRVKENCEDKIKVFDVKSFNSVFHDEYAHAVSAIGETVGIWGNDNNLEMANFIQGFANGKGSEIVDQLAKEIMLYSRVAKEVDAYSFIRSKPAFQTGDAVSSVDCIRACFAAERLKLNINFRLRLLNLMKERFVPSEADPYVVVNLSGILDGKNITQISEGNLINLRAKAKEAAREPNANNSLAGILAGNVTTAMPDKFHK